MWRKTKRYPDCPQCKKLARIEQPRIYKDAREKNKMKKRRQRERAAQAKEAAFNRLAARLS